MTSESVKRRSATPVVSRAASVERNLAEFQDKLRIVYGLEPFGAFSVVVEGLTDVDYLTIASEKLLEAIGVDLLDAAASGCGDARISICTPVEAQHPDPAMRLRGGSKQLGRLIRFLRGFTSVFEGTTRLCFVVDHDEAGRGTLKALGDSGFATEYMGLSLDPCHHPTACSQTDVVIEDLLSLRIQKAFFDNGGCTCHQIFVEGDLQSIEWDGDSKGQLPSFVRENGTLSDVIELARVLVRVREIWGLPVPDLSIAATARL